MITMQDQPTTYQILMQDFTRAVSTGDLGGFGEWLEKRLHVSPRFYLGWLFLARVRDRSDDPAGADSCYAEAARLALPTSLPRLIDELIRFKEICGREQALLIARQRLGLMNPSIPTSSHDSYPIAGAVPPAARPPEPPARLPAAREQVVSVHTVPPRPPVPPAPPPAQQSPIRLPAPAPAPKPATMVPVSRPLGAAGDRTILPRPRIDATPKQRSAKGLRKRGSLKPPADPGELEPQVRGLREQYDQGDRSANLLLRLGQILQRLGRHPEAITFLDQAIKQNPMHTVLAHLNAKAQILSSQQRWADAAREFERLVQYERRPRARRFHRIQLALMFRNDRRLEDARRILDGLIRENPDDLTAVRFRRSLDQPLVPFPLRVGSDGGPPLERVYVSRLIECDLQRAEFRDPPILAKGGKPDYSDARRLWQLADRARTLIRLIDHDVPPAAKDKARAFFESVRQGAMEVGQKVKATRRVTPAQRRALINWHDAVRKWIR
jgi:tetratricopeptide (TPR) repeat protein